MIFESFFLLRVFSIVRGIERFDLITIDIVWRSKLLISEGSIDRFVWISRSVCDYNCGSSQQVGLGSSCAPLNPDFKNDPSA